jgi:hypothetical protein
MAVIACEGGLLRIPALGLYKPMASFGHVQNMSIFSLHPTSLLAMDMRPQLRISVKEGGATEGALGQEPLPQSSSMPRLCHPSGNVAVRPTVEGGGIDASEGAMEVTSSKGQVAAVLRLHPS